MNSELRAHKKLDKRIVKLGLKKGIIEPVFFKTLYWANYTIYKGPSRKRKKGYTSGKNYNFHRYYSELHYCTVDYWGEGDEHVAADLVLQEIRWNSFDHEKEKHPPRLSLQTLLDTLRRMPTVCGKQAMFSELRVKP